MDLKYLDKICIAGWQRTGVSLAKLLLSLDKKIKVSEKKPQNYFSSSLISNFQKRGVEFEFGGHSPEFIKEAGLVLVSPGINLFTSFLGKIIRENNLAYMGELEFASYFSRAKIIAITGTNGKTTTAHLTYLLLKKKGKKVYLGGNVGRPLSEIVLKAKKRDLIVLEVSSFQLETVIKFRPNVAALLNVYPDHLGRHKDFNSYLKIKMKIFQNQKKGDKAIVNRNNKFFKTFYPRPKAEVIYFGGEFSSENLSCAYKIGSLFGVSKTDCLCLFAQYKNLPHRRQQVKTLGKVKFINDSKATNPSSTLFALDAIKGKIILIAGGKDKGLDYSIVGSYARKIKKINLIGQAAVKIERDLRGKIRCQRFGSLEKAVFSSYREALAGETVLFSPMCSSFDMFSDYQDRGRSFIRSVKNISC